MSLRTLKGEFFFDPDDRIYETHFPSCPVVPGSVMIEGFLRVISHSFENQERLIVKNFRFKEFLWPGIYNYEVDLKANNFFCTLLSRGRTMAKGTISFEG